MGAVPVRAHRADGVPRTGRRTARVRAGGAVKRTAFRAGHRDGGGLRRWGFGRVGWAWAGVGEVCAAGGRVPGSRPRSLFTRTVRLAGRFARCRRTFRVVSRWPGGPAAAGKRGQGVTRAAGSRGHVVPGPRAGDCEQEPNGPPAGAGRRRTGLPLPSRSRNSRAGGLSRIRGRITLTLSRLVSAYPAGQSQRLLNQPLS
jgi:hypothetical protein